MMKKRIRKCLTVTLCAILLFSVAAAEEPVLSDREKAIMLADKAIEEKYGLTLLTREYLSCSVEKEAENAYTVRYGGIEGLDDVLGIYQVAVENGTVTDVSWSYDGEDTSGGLNAMAWGRDQLMTMLRINQETGSMDSIYEYADEITKRICDWLFRRKPFPASYLKAKFIFYDQKGKKFVSKVEYSKFKNGKWYWPDKDYSFRYLIYKAEVFYISTKRR